jgi:hypothetical protein
MTVTIVVMTEEVRQRIAASTAAGGVLSMQCSAVDDLFVIRKVEVASGSTRALKPGREYTALRATAGAEYQGQWLREVPEGTNVTHYALRHRPGTAISYSDFHKLVPLARKPVAGKALLLVTYETDIPEDLLRAGVQEFAAWNVTSDQVTPMTMAVEPTVVGLDQLKPQWPVEKLAERRVGVLALGSIGGVIADSLAGYGVGTLDLIDPDRFLWHNGVRHVLGLESVGRHKVDAMRDWLKRRWPGLTVNTHPVDFTEQAHVMRGLMGKLDALTCSADGIAARRVASHLARRAGIPAVLACVLGDGTIGEVMRLRPGPAYGCLMCHRAKMVEEDAMDVEVLQERDYGTGSPHKPMTAVGPDLWVVGQLAAKATVATILEAKHGDLGHRLPGDLAILGLRPSTPYDPPYDVQSAGELVWRSLPPPRPDCPTCSAA